MKWLGPTAFSGIVLQGPPVRQFGFAGFNCIQLPTVPFMVLGPKDPWDDGIRDLKPYMVGNWTLGEKFYSLMPCH